MVTLTVWARRNNSLLILAVMTHQQSARAVHGQARIATFTLGNPAALMAQHRGRKAAAIEKNEYLLLICQRFSDSLQGRLGNTTLSDIGF